MTTIVITFNVHIRKTLIIASTTNTDAKLDRKKIPIPVRLVRSSNIRISGGLVVASNIKPITKRAGSIGPAHAIVS